MSLLLILRHFSGHLLVEFLEEFTGFCLSPGLPSVRVSLEVDHPLLVCHFSFCSPFPGLLSLPFQDSHESVIGGCL